MQAGEAELALRAYTRAIGQRGADAETLTALGSATMALGRLGQAERLFRRATEADPGFALAWNNLGAVLLERGRTGDAVVAFERAFALDSGRTAAIRDNLQLALSRLDSPR